MSCFDSLNRFCLGKLTKLDCFQPSGLFLPATPAHSSQHPATQLQVNQWTARTTPRPQGVHLARSSGSRNLLTRTASALPADAARCSGVLPVASLRLGLAPALSNRRSRPTLPLLACRKRKVGQWVPSTCEKGYGLVNALLTNKQQVHITFCVLLCGLWKRSIPHEGHH